MKNWKTTQLGDLAKITMGHSPASAHYNTKGVGLPLIQGNADVDNFRRTYIRNWTSVVTNVCQKGDVVMSVRAPAGTISKASFDSCLGRGVCSIKYANDYLYHYLIFKEQKWKGKSAGSTFDSVTGDEIKKFEIHHPEDICEQQKIAAILSDIDALIETQEALIAKKKNDKAATMELLLTGKKRLPGFNDEWENSSLWEMSDKKKEFFDDGDWIEAAFLADSGVRLIQTGAIGIGSYKEQKNKKYISRENFALLKCKKLIPGDILICRLAEPAGRACLFGDLGESDVITAVDVTIFRPTRNYNRSFLVYLMNRDEWFKDILNLCGGSTRTRIARSELGQMVLKTPAIKEQHAISTVLSVIDEELSLLQNEHDKLVSQKNAVMHKLLTGEIRLP